MSAQTAVTRTVHRFATDWGCGGGTTLVPATALVPSPGVAGPGKRWCLEFVAGRGPAWGGVLEQARGPLSRSRMNE